MRVQNFKDYKISHGLHSAGGCRKYLFEQEKGRFSGVRDTQRDKAFGREQEQKIWYHDFLLFANLNNKRATKPVQVRQNEV